MCLVLLVSQVCDVLFKLRVSLSQSAKLALTSRLHSLVLVIKRYRWWLSQYVCQWLPDG